MLGLPKELAKKGVATNFVYEPENLLQCNKVTLGLSAGVFFFLFFAKKILPKSVADFKELIVLVGSGIFYVLFGKENGVQVVGAVAKGLPALSIPIASNNDLHMAKEMFSGAA